MKYKIVYSRTTGPNWANFGTKHSLVNGILVDYKEIAKKKKPLMKYKNMSSVEPLDQFQPNLFGAMCVKGTHYFLLIKDYLILIKEIMNFLS